MTRSQNKKNVYVGLFWRVLNYILCQLEWSALEFKAKEGWSECIGDCFFSLSSTTTSAAFLFLSSGSFTKISVTMSMVGWVDLHPRLHWSEYIGVSFFCLVRPN